MRRCFAILFALALSACSAAADLSAPSASGQKSVVPAVSRSAAFRRNDDPPYFQAFQQLSDASSCTPIYFGNVGLEQILENDLSAVRHGMTPVVLIIASSAINWSPIYGACSEDAWGYQVITNSRGGGF